MYKILLADDEGIVLDSLQFILQQKFGDQCEITTAKSGRGVIEQVHQAAPDIVIMDIQMPGINGIEAMREIRSFNKQLLFIVISAYDKFTFAKDALNLGAMDYITKPFTKERVTKVVEQAMALIDRKRKKRSDDLSVREKLQTVIPIIENGFINLILFQEDFSADMERYRTLLDIEEAYGTIMTLEFGEPGSDDNVENAIGSSVMLQNSTFSISEIVKDYFHKAVVGSIMANKMVVFLPCQPQETDYEERTRNVDLARNLVHKLGEKLNLKFRCGIGAVWEFLRLHQSYEESKKALRIGRGAVVHIQDLGLGCEYAADYPLDLEGKLFYYIKEGNVPGTRDMANRFFDWMVDRYGDYEDDIKTKVLEFVMLGEKEVFLQGGMQYQFLSRQNYLREVLSCAAYGELRGWFLDKLIAASENITLKKQEKNRTVVDKAKDYIGKRYDKEMSLEEVAKYVDISSYYFSKLFKEAQGVNFIDYVTSLRIEKAKKMLVTHKVSVKEVGVDVGYSDPNYFSRIFKKVVGCTPTEYREGVERST